MQQELRITDNRDNRLDLLRTPTGISVRVQPGVMAGTEGRTEVVLSLSDREALVMFLGL
jgi:hypothetical protein